MYSNLYCENSVGSCTDSIGPGGNVKQILFHTRNPLSSNSAYSILDNPNHPPNQSDLHTYTTRQAVWPHFPSESSVLSLPRIGEVSVMYVLHLMHAFLDILVIRFRFSVSFAIPYLNDNQQAYTKTHLLL